MNVEDSNNEVASLWAASIETAMRDGGARSVRATAKDKQFRFFSLNQLAPITDASHDAVAEDQRKLAAHAIIASLMRSGIRAFVAAPSEKAVNQWTRLHLKEIMVDVDYGNFSELSEPDPMVFQVVFDLYLHTKALDGQGFNLPVE